MERSSKKELLIYIEEQEKSLQKYKSKLHDVVESYKNILKEKQALESSVKALTENNAQIPGNCSNSENEENNASTNVGDTSDVEEANAIDSLKSSLRTLVSEKTRAENELKIDRKKLLKEKDELENQIHLLEENFQQERRQFETTIQETKRQIRDLQRDREKEQEDHVLMLKELQSLVADERSAKEKLEQQAENLKLALEKLPDKRFEYESRISELQNELSSAKDLLQVAEGEKRDMPSLLKQLQQEMNEMKLRHLEAVEREVKRANEAEGKLKALAKVSEQRSSNLESRLSELSLMVGNYDKLRQQDQIAIQKLKDRVAQLDQENSALAKAVSHTEKKIDFEDDFNSDVHTLVEKINKLKNSLQIAYQNSKKSNSMTDFVNEALKTDDLFLHTVCQKEISKLKGEIEEYKKLLHSTQVEKSMKPQVNTEVKVLKGQVVNLQEKLQLCQSQLESVEDFCRKNEESVQHQISEMKLKHLQEQNTLQSEFQSKVFELETQLQKQRERSLKVIEEKENEIIFMKSTYLPLIEEKKNSKQKISDEEFDEKTISRKSSISNEEVNQLRGSAISIKNGGGLLHYTQEIARKDVEISKLRRARLQAETALRDLQQSSLLKEEKMQNEMDVLYSQIERTKDSNKGINMEYLKNVFLRFIQSNDSAYRSHMINAIAAILHFTPRELQQIKIYKYSL